MDCGPGWQQGQLDLCNLDQEEGSLGWDGGAQDKRVSANWEEPGFLKLRVFRRIPERSSWKTAHTTLLFAARK